MQAHRIGARGAGSVEQAYRLVAAGYEEALKVPDLPEVEVQSLRACLRAAREIAQLPHIALLARSESEVN